MFICIILLYSIGLHSKQKELKHFTRPLIKHNPVGVQIISLYKINVIESKE